MRVKDTINFLLTSVGSYLLLCANTLARFPVTNDLGEESDWGELIVEIVKPRFSYLKGDIYDSKWIPYYGEYEFKADDLFVLRFIPFFIHKFISGELIHMVFGSIGLS